MERNLSFHRKCELLGVSPSTAYAKRQSSASGRNEEDMELARKIEEIYLKYPFYGSRRMAREISREGSPVNRKRIQRLMRLMDLAGPGSRPRDEQTASAAQDLSLPFEEPQDRASEPGMEQRHHLHADQIRIPVPDGRGRLAQPPHPRLQAVQHNGRRLLRGGTGGGAQEVRHA